MSIDQTPQPSDLPVTQVATPTLSEQPISEAIEARKTKTTKPPHPYINSPDPAVYPFPPVPLVKDEQGNITNWNTGIPDDYSSDVHAPLVKKDFKEGWQYYQYKADKVKAQHAVYIEQRNEAQLLGNKTNQAAMKRFQAMQKQMALIAQQLMADGIEVDLNPVSFPDLDAAKSSE